MSLDWQTILGIVGGGGLVGILGALGKVLSMLVALDRRIEAKADALTVLALEKKVDAAAVTRSEVCSAHRQETQQRIADIERETSARIAAQDKRLAVLLERLDGIQRGQDEIRQMLATLFEREGLTPLPRRPLPRQRTGGGDE